MDDIKAKACEYAERRAFEARNQKETTYGNFIVNVYDEAQAGFLEGTKLILDLWHDPKDTMPPQGVYVLVYLREPINNSNYSVEVACGDPNKCSGWRRFSRGQVLGWRKLPFFTLAAEVEEELSDQN